MRALAGIFLGRRRRVLLSDMANHFKIRPLTHRKRACEEDQRLWNVSGAFERLRRSLANMARPVPARSTPGRLVYLQARFEELTAFRS